ncbi:hypothetical protein BDW74DRAFT_21028 [Aspergillus multicolor]|uniref:uncharacterized protein n=1 Tax=Aspergillus multicolor TaxID=41759 RepID=UPI003CCDEAF6
MIRSEAFQGRTEGVAITESGQDFFGSGMSSSKPLILPIPNLSFSLLSCRSLRDLVRRTSFPFFIVSAIAALALALSFEVVEVINVIACLPFFSDRLYIN